MPGPLTIEVQAQLKVLRECALIQIFINKKEETIMKLTLYMVSFMATGLIAIPPVFIGTIELSISIPIFN